MPALFRFFALVFFCAVSFATQASTRIVIDFVPGVQPSTPASALTSQPPAPGLLSSLLAELAFANGVGLNLVRPFGDSGAVVLLDSQGAQLDQVLARLRSDPSVANVAIDRLMVPHAQSPLIGILNELDLSRRPRSWFHQAVAAQPASINTSALWANYHGTAPVVVAVADTGVLPDHPMLRGRLLPGYDMISTAAIAADGQTSAAGERDPDPTDPGDGVSALDITNGAGCGILRNSTWHGTFVSGLLAGNPNPNEGVFSVARNAAVLPIRVLGRCGGFSTDLADGIRWAAGLSVAGVPSNPFPARVINLSLGAQGSCVPFIEGAAVSAARAAGALVVVSAGNDGATVDTPANCPGAFGVAAIDQEGLKANYSNFGPSIQMSAPGGDSAFPIWSASNTGLRGPLTNTYTTKVGTSFSAPLVAGAAAIYLGLRPDASVAELETALRASARPFVARSGLPTCSTTTTNVACNCTTSNCGAGMLDVNTLLRQVSGSGFTNLFSNTGNIIAPNTTKRFSAEGSTNRNGQEVSAVSFQVSNIVRSAGSNATPVLSASGLVVDVTAPSGVEGFDLMATTPNGSSSVVSVVVSASGATSPTLLAGLLGPLINGVSSGVPPPAGGDGGASNPPTDESGAGGAPSTGGGGGGGGLGLLGLFALLLLSGCFKRTLEQKI